MRPVRGRRCVLLLLVLRFFFFVVGLRSAAPSALQRRGLESRRPRGLGVVWLFLSGFATRTDGASVRLALNGGTGGFVLWCCAVAGLRGRGVHALPVWLPIHCTIFPALQPVIRPPCYILFTSSSVSPSSENGRPERWISASISGSLGVLVGRGLPKRRQRRSCSLRFPGYPNFVI